ncbi:MAG: hypothetical protein HEEMFOPI_00769 [Holosporales bacterium]
MKKHIKMLALSAMLNALMLGANYCATPYVKDMTLEKNKKYSIDGVEFSTGSGKFVLADSVKDVLNAFLKVSENLADAKTAIPSYDDTKSLKDNIRDAIAAAGAGSPAAGIVDNGFPVDQTAYDALKADHGALKTDRDNAKAVFEDALKSKKKLKDPNDLTQGFKTEYDPADNMETAAEKLKKKMEKKRVSKGEWKSAFRDSGIPTEDALAARSRWDRDRLSVEGERDAWTNEFRDPNNQAEDAPAARSRWDGARTTVEGERNALKGERDDWASAFRDPNNQAEDANAAKTRWGAHVQSVGTGSTTSGATQLHDELKGRLGQLGLDTSNINTVDDAQKAMDDKLSAERQLAADAAQLKAFVDQGNYAEAGNLVRGKDAEALFARAGITNALVKRKILR